MKILTTHAGSLPRPHDLLDAMKAKATGKGFDAARYESLVKAAVDACVRRQVDSGIDIVTDGEQSKPGFFLYVKERLEGFTPRPGMKRKFFEAEVAAFPEYYAQYFKQAMVGGAVAPVVPMVCTAPVKYRGEAAVARDIANLKAAAAAAGAKGVFMPAVAPSGVGANEYYKTEEEYFHAVGAALRNEYKAIVDAGLTLQIDDPFLSELFADEEFDMKGRRARARMYVEALNESLRGLPPEKIRFHTCYGINEGPRIHDVPLLDLVPLLLRINAQAYSFEAANPRHLHEWHVWEQVKLPDDKLLIPGMICHAYNIVEHPELIADFLVTYANLVGRERVIAGADCGFSSSATFAPEVDAKVVWAKFEALSEGARLASERLWH